jgi:holo-[acyl-carrier protein] synthase
LIFGIGTDIIEVSRVREKLERTKGLRERLFTSREIAYCGAKRASARHYAARFAAKEAFFKAMGTGWRGGFRFDEIEIINDESGKPGVAVHGKVKSFCRKAKISGMQVSLAHGRDLAIAFVVLEKKSV